MEKELKTKVDDLSREVDALRKEIKEMRSLLNEIIQIIVLKMEALEQEDEEIYYT